MNNRNKIKLIALDIDGTIMDRQFRISDRVKNDIAKAIDQGIYVALATGRMYSATVPIATGLGIKTPLITYQGSMVREFYESNKVILHYTISPDLAQKVIQELKKFDVQINVYFNDELFVEDESHVLKEYAGRRHIIYHKVDSFDKILELKPTKILVMDNNPPKTDEIKGYLRSIFSNRLYITKSTPVYCEIVNNKASKGKAILHLAKMWGIDKSEIMVIGDQDNDKEMLEIAGVSVAMGNGDEELKKIASYITDTVENDGAALAMEKFALN